MAGERKVLGAIYPNDGWVDEDMGPVLEEWRRFLPDSVRMVSCGTPIPSQDLDVTFGAWMAANGDIEIAAKRLLRHQPDAFAYYCTTASFVRGIGGDEEISRRVTEATGLPCTTTSSASVKALRAVGARRIAVASPYPADVHAALVRFLNASGFDVVRDKALLVSQQQLLVTPEEVRTVAKEVDDPRADGIFISCTGLRTAPIIDDLERELGKPIVSANQATGWDSLRLLGLEARLPGLGSLFAGEPALAAHA